MVPHDALINALRSLKFKFKRQADRVDLFKQRGTTARVAVRRNQWHDETYARTILRQAGMDAGAIEAFVANVRTTKR